MVLRVQETCGTVSLVRCMDHDNDSHRPADIVRLDYALDDPVYCHIFKSQLSEMARWFKAHHNLSIDISEPVTEFGSTSYIRRRNLYQSVEDNYDGGLRSFTLRFGAQTYELQQLSHVPTWPGIGPSH